MKMQELSQAVTGLRGHPLFALSAVNLLNVPPLREIRFHLFYYRQPSPLLRVLSELCGESFLSTAVPQQGNNGFPARRSIFFDRGALNG